MTQKGEKAQARYFRAMHGVQSAIAFEINLVGNDKAAANPKHLRTGINSCLVDSSAVAKLLMEKGVFTEEEYLIGIAEAAERELETLTKKMQNLTGKTNISFA